MRETVDSIPLHLYVKVMGLLLSFIKSPSQHALESGYNTEIMAQSYASESGEIIANE